MDASVAPVLDGAPDDARMDASASIDADTGPSADAASFPLDADAMGSDGAPLDAPLGSDDDAGPCLCELPGICQVFEGCLAGACQYADAADGTPCMGSGMCVAGACAAGGCGNGLLDTGEECDDGNRLEGDACSPDCRSVPFSLGEGWPTAAGPAIGVDDTGTLLAVWTAPRRAAGSEPSLAVVAARISAQGRILDAAPLSIEADLPLGWAATPRVAGLASGWAITWRSPFVEGAAELGGIALAIVDATGIVASVRPVNEEHRFDQSEPHVARVGDGLVVAWTDRSGLGASGTRLT